MKRLRLARDICLLLAVVIYSGAHMPSGDTFARAFDSFGSAFSVAYHSHVK